MLPQRGAGHERFGLWAGIGLGTFPADKLARDILIRRFEAKCHWQQTQTLIIDEISMIDADLFDKLEAIARIVRGNSRPFGGMQLIVCGDFAQLPPVKAKGGYVFQAKSWCATIKQAGLPSLLSYRAASL